MRTSKGLSKFILMALEKSLEGYVRAEDFIYNPHKYLYGYSRKINKPLILQAIKRLKERGYVEYVDVGKVVFKLTDSGLDQVFRSKLQLDDKGVWDGIWRIITFDIPEDQRIARDLLRFKLKEWGFVKIQRSVWATKKNCTSVMRKFIEELGISKWVLVMESSDPGF